MRAVFWAHLGKSEKYLITTANLFLENSLLFEILLIYADFVSTFRKSYLDHKMYLLFQLWDLHRGKHKSP